MSPRVKPKLDPAKAAAYAAASADYQRGKKRALADAVERHGLEPIHTVERSALRSGIPPLLLQG